MKNIKTLILLSASFGPTLLGGSFYLNSVTDTGATVQYSDNSYTAIGDHITLGSTGLATDATAQFFNVSPTSGIFDATLRLYSVGVSPSVLGALLGTYTVTNIPITGFDISNPLTTGTTTVKFSGLNINVPTELIFMISLANVTNADLGLTLFDPPTVGSSDNSSFIADSGSGASVISTDPGFGNVNFELIQTPEPGTISLLGGGLALLGFAIRRKRV